MSSYIEVKDGNGATVKMRGHYVGDEFCPESCSTPTGGIGNYLSKFAANEVGGSEDANGNYSVTPAVFSIAPSAGEVWYVARLLVYIEDSGSFDSGGYGNGSALANGIAIKIVSDGVDVISLTNDQPIKQNTHWKKFCFDIETSKFGSGNESLGSRWTFTKGGTYIKLDGDLDEKIEVRLSDDMSDLVSQTFLFQGYTED